MKIFRTTFALIFLSGFWPLQALSASAPAKYVVGYATYTARIVPLWLAQEQGFFTKYGIDVDPVFIRGAPTLVAGMAAGSIHIGRTGGSAILAAVSAGHDFKIVSTFNSRNTYDLVVRPHIKRAEDLRGKTFAVTSIGGTSWMGILLWLEYLGLDQQRDNIRMQVIGDQAVQVQCVENGLCDAAAVDGVFSRQLKQKGMTILGEYTDVKTLLVGQTMAVPATLLQQRPEIAESYLRGEIEALAFFLAPKNKPIIKDFSALAQGGFRRQRRRLPGPRPWCRPQTVRVPRRDAQCPAASQIAKSQSRRSQSRRRHRQSPDA